VQAHALRNLVAEQKFKKDIMFGELGVKHTNDDRILPAGIYTLSTNVK
jgi:hypothetical protein